MNCDNKTFQKMIDRAKRLMNLTPEQAFTVRLSLLFAHDKKGRKVDLANLATFPDEDFVHDVNGIDAHASRETEKCGLLENLFVPRCGFAN